MTNQLRLVAVLQQRGVIRFTPAGLPMLDTRLLHRSSQSQESIVEMGRAGGSSGAATARAPAPRQVEFDLAALFPGALAARADRLAVGATLEVTGFLAARRMSSKTLVLHVTEFSVLADPAPDDRPATDV